MSDVIQLKSAFVNAAYAKIGPNMIRCTADIHNGVLLMQFVMRKGCNEDDLDEVREIIGDIIGLSPELFGREEIIEVEGADELLSIPARSIPLFRITDRYL